MSAMAQRRHVIVTDDIDGTEGARSYRFSWQDAQYEIDLTDAHRDELIAALQPFITAGRRVRGKGPSRGARGDGAGLRADVRDRAHRRERIGGHPAELRLEPACLSSCDTECDSRLLRGEPHHH